tara:strand:- start:187 stop:375 length:189 start_codon:yes stop_codon:yes gene_type:complete
MKKLILILSVASIFALTSCNKCKTCSIAGIADVEYCENDYPGGNTAYNTAINALEAAGWDCK